MFAEDLTGYLADFGVPCVFASFTFTAIFDQPETVDDFGPAKVQSAQYSIRFVTSQAALTPGLVGTVGGVAFKTRDTPRPYADGVFSTCLLTKV